MDWKKKLGDMRPMLAVKAPEKAKPEVIDATREDSSAEIKLTRLIVEDADTLLPEYFRGSQGEQTLKQIKSWLSSIVPEKKVTYLSRRVTQTIPEALKSFAGYFEGRAQAYHFESMFRNHIVTKLRFAVGEPKVPTSAQAGMYLAPQDRGRCIFLVAGFYEGETPLYFRSFLIRSDGKVRGPPMDEVPSKS